VEKALAFDPADRYPDMQRFADALQRTPHHRDQVWTAATLPSPKLTARLRAQLPRTRIRRTVVIALATSVLLLVGAAGSALVVLGRGAPTGATTRGGVPIVRATRTTAATTPPAQPSVTPHDASTATPVPHPSPTPVPSPSPTLSPTPAPTLLIQPTPLVLQPNPQNPSACVATQTITNTTGQTVGWQWQPPQAGGFHFQINGGPQMDWPKDLPPGQSGIAPHGTDTLTATSNCQPSNQPPKVYGILLTDTRGDQYTFVLQLQ
jgi:hypothetical protein